MSWLYHRCVEVDLVWVFGVSTFFFHSCLFCSNFKCVFVCVREKETETETEVCMANMHDTLCMRRSEDYFVKSALLPPSLGFQGLNSNCQACISRALFEPFCQPFFSFCWGKDWLRKGWYQNYHPTVSVSNELGL